MMLMFRMLESVPIGSLKNYMLVMNIYIYGASGISLIAKSTDIMNFVETIYAFVLYIVS